MPVKSRRTRSLGPAIAWALNLGAIVLLLGILGAYLARQPAEASSAPFVYLGGTPRATGTPVPTSYYLPTITPNPLSTPIEDYSSPTPFVFDGAASRAAGYSVLGQPLLYYTFGHGERKYLIVAGIHGGYEGNTSDLANQLVVYISQNPEAVPSDATLMILPGMNPDGAGRGRNADARVNANGVDLNRNFPSSNWAADWERRGCWNHRPTTGGPYAGSEPETRAVMNLISSNRFVALISYHSAALGVFPGGDPWEPASERLASALSEVTGYPYPPVETGCRYTGTLADWAVENGVQGAVDMELSNHQDADFARNLRALKALLGFHE